MTEPLPPYDHDAPCPKCRFMAGTTEFHPGYHGSPCGAPGANDLAVFDRLAGMMGSGMTYPNAALYKGGRDDPEYIRIKAVADKNMDDYNARRKAIPEHFDRACPNCKHLWAERPV